MSGRCCAAAPYTCSTVTPVMQRWSMGHSRSRQGAQETGCRTSLAPTPNGDVVCQSVGPKTATSGTLNAAATCMGPVSFVRNSWQRFTSASNSRTVVRPEQTTVRALIERGLRSVVSGRRAKDRVVLRDASFRGDGLVAGRTLSDWEAIRDLSYSERGA